MNKGKFICFLAILNFAFIEGNIDKTLRKLQEEPDDIKKVSDGNKELSEDSINNKELQNDKEKISIIYEEASDMSISHIINYEDKYDINLLSDYKEPDVKEDKISNEDISDIIIKKSNKNISDNNKELSDENNSNDNNKKLSYDIEILSNNIKELSDDDKKLSDNIGENYSISQIEDIPLPNIYIIGFSNYEFYENPYMIKFDIILRLANYSISEADNITMNIDITTNRLRFLEEEEVTCIKKQKCHLKYIDSFAQKKLVGLFQN